MKFGPGVEQACCCGQACRPFAHLPTFHGSESSPSLAPLSPTQQQLQLVLSTAAAATPITREWDAQSLLARRRELVLPACLRRRRQQRQPRRDGRIFAGFNAEAYHHAHLYAERARRVRVRCLLARTSPFSSPLFIMMSRAELDRFFNDTAMKKRCVQFPFFPSEWL